MTKNKNLDKQKKIRVFIGIPNEGHTQPEAYNNRMDMCFHLGQLQTLPDSPFQFIFGNVGRLLTPKAREELARIAVSEDCDYLFMIDDDMLCPVDIFEKLFAHNVDIVAPLAFQRRPPYYPVCYIHKKGYDKVRHQSYFSNEIVKNYPKDILFEVDAVGFGAVLIKRKVLDAVQTPRFMSTEGTGEDILFCYRAKEEAGAKVFMDTATEILHLGAPIIVGEKEFETENDMDEIRKYNKEYKHEDNKGESDVSDLKGNAIYVN